jgi:hypothetical protein
MLDIPAFAGMTTLIYIVAGVTLMPGLGTTKDENGVVAIIR